MPKQFYFGTTMTTMFKLAPQLTLLALALGAASCADSSEPEVISYYTHIEPILQTRCAGCHTADGIAPFALDSFAAVSRSADAVAAAVVSRTMPPWLAGDADVTYLGNPSLTDSQIDTIVDWVSQGKAEGNVEARGEPLAQLGEPLDRVDSILRMPEAYTPPKGDDYRCFLLPWEHTETRYVTGLNALPGNESVVHHIAVFIIPPDAAGIAQTWQSDDGQAGYSCFGGPSGDPDNFIPTLQLGGWLPGNPASKFPRGIGIEVKPGSLIALQMHYSSPLGVAEPDQTSIELQIETTVANRGVYAPWLDVQWVGGNMPIPAGESNVTHSIREDPRTFFAAFIGGLDLSNGFDIHGALFHMHQLGEQGHASVYKNDQETRILSIPKWDFNWQQEYFLTHPVAFEPGDELELSCTWNNSLEAQPTVGDEQRAPANVNWGERTEDEMCVVNLLITEPIP